MSDVDEVVVTALAELAAGRPGSALAELTSPRAGSGGARLRRELAGYLATRHGGRIYDDPAAFRAFIDGGGNVELYRATAARLAAAYRDLGVRGVLDLGSGDGRAVLAAAAELGGRAPEFDLVEPSAALLAAATEAARAAGLAARAHPRTVQELLADPPARRWDLVQATFALHAIPTRERTGILAGLRGLAAAMLLVEFDVPAFDDGGPAHLAYLAERYERGLAEYEGSLVAQGFLMPVLVAQVEPGRPRQTWEQPAAAWAAQLRAAGWREVTVAPLAGYWWAPAVAILSR